MILGITGNFGSGKSTVAKMFERLGAYVIDADKICHSLMRPSQKPYKKLVKCFGRGILKKDKTIDRRKLGDIVFKDKKQLLALNRIIHPEALRQIAKLIQKKKKHKTVVIDAALLVEWEFQKKLDILIVVKTKGATQIKRTIASKGMTREEVVQRIRMQAPLKKKIAFADFIIDNSSSKTKTFLRVQKIWEKIVG